MSHDLPIDPDLLDQLWDFGDPAVSEQRFRSRIADAAPDLLATRELATQLARSLGLQGRYAEADAVLDDIVVDDPLVAARVVLERGRLRNSSDDRAAAVPLFLAALSHARAAGNDDLATDAAHMLAIADDTNAAHWVAEGLAMIDATGDARARRWRGPLHNNLGWTYHDRGAHEAALEQFRLALAAFERGGTATQVHNARWAVARCLRSLGRNAEALAILERLAANDPPDPFVAEEIAALVEAPGA